jgi:hypothetical protein
VLILALVLALAQSAEEKASQKAAEKAAAEAVAAFEKAFKGAETEKMAALGELSRTPHLKTANRLGLVLGGGESGKVRAAAARALGSFSDEKKKAGGVLSVALGPSKPDPTIFWAICAAIAELQEPSAASALAKYFDDKDENVARVAIECAGKSGCSVNIDVLIAQAAHCEKIIRAAVNAAGLHHTDSSGNTVHAPPELRPRDRAIALLKVIQEALRAITKENIATSDGWSAWWSRNRETFDRK